MTTKETIMPDEASALRVITLEADILEANQKTAADNRAYLEARGICALNLISSPGSGKTSLLVETLARLKDEIGCAVIEGDQQTSNDARRIAETSTPVVQVNTRQACHLEATHVRQALEALPLDRTRLLFIENVGNLVCPAEFDLGETAKVVLMSITEGEDKPAKYPLAFHLARACVLTKLDLLPYLHFDLALCLDHLRQVNAGLPVLQTSTYREPGIEAWLAWLRALTGIQGA
jgi:hydrogenase nickel incorporation protein HypB